MLPVLEKKLLVEHGVPVVWLKTMCSRQNYPVYIYHLVKCWPLSQKINVFFSENRYSDIYHSSCTGTGDHYPYDNTFLFMSKILKNK